VAQRFVEVKPENTQLHTVSTNINRIKSELEPRFKRSSYAISVTIETPAVEEDRRLKHNTGPSC